MCCLTPRATQGLSYVENGSLLDAVRDGWRRAPAVPVLQTSQYSSSCPYPITVLRIHGCAGSSRSLQGATSM